MHGTPRTKASRLAAWAALLGSVGCTRIVSPEALDACLRTEGTRTILLADGLSLYSPYEAVSSHQYLERLRAERDACFALFGVHSDEPVLVQLRVDPGLGVDVTVVDGERVQLNGFSTRTDAGNTGYAGELRVVLLVDAPRELTLADGRTLTSAFSPEQYTSVMRHELAHVASLLLGLPRQSWLLEGIAHAVEFAPALASDGRLGFEPRPEQLRWAARLPVESRSIDALLSWRATTPPGPAEEELRLLAYSLVAFLLEREPASTLRAGLLRIRALSPAELRALQPAWSAWLDALAQAP